VGNWRRPAALSAAAAVGAAARESPVAADPPEMHQTK